MRPPQYALAPIEVAAHDEGKRARAILDALASRERTLRLKNAYGWVIAGATTLGIGVFTER